LTVAALKRQLAAARKMRTGTSGKRLRELAEHVNIDVLRKIDDPEDIMKRFAELRGHLLAWADVVDPQPAGGTVNSWQDLVGKKPKVEKPCVREVSLSITDSQTRQVTVADVKRPISAFMDDLDGVRAELHARLDAILNKMWGIK
jgi:hypothetical protein